MRTADAKTQSTAGRACSRRSATVAAGDVDSASSAGGREAWLPSPLLRWHAVAYCCCCDQGRKQDWDLEQDLPNFVGMVRKAIR